MTCLGRDKQDPFWKVKRGTCDMLAEIAQQSCHGADRMGGTCSYSFRIGAATGQAFLLISAVHSNDSVGSSVCMSVGSW